MSIKKSVWAMLVALGMLVSACDDDDTVVGGGEPVTAVEIGVAKGAVSGATCTVSDPVNGIAYETDPSLVTTDTSGVATFGIIGTIEPESVILVSCSGGTYFDEASGVTVDVPAGETIDSVVPSTDVATGTAAVAVTPLTDIAAEQVLALLEAGVPVDATTADDANAEVAALFGIDDITAPPTVVNSTAPTELGASGDLTDADAYAVALAALSYAAAELGTDPFSLTAAIAEDASDGTVDGTVDGVPVTVPTSTGEVEAYTSLDDLDESLDSAAVTYSEDVEEETGNTTIVDDVAAETEEPRDGDITIEIPSGSGGS